MKKLDILTILLCMALFGAYYTSKTKTKDLVSSAVGFQPARDSVPETKNDKSSNTATNTTDMINRMLEKDNTAARSTTKHQMTDDVNTQKPSTNQATIAAQEEPSIPPDTHEPTETDLENQEQEAILEEIIEKQRQEDEEVLLNPDKKVRRKW